MGASFAVGEECLFLWPPFLILVLSQGLEKAVEARQTVLDAAQQLEDLVPRVNEFWKTVSTGLEVLYDNQTKAQHGVVQAFEAIRGTGEAERREKERLQKELAEARGALEASSRQQQRAQADRQEAERLRKELEEVRKQSEETSRRLRGTEEDRNRTQKLLRDREEELRSKTRALLPPSFVFFSSGPFSDRGLRWCR